MGHLDCDSLVLRGKFCLTLVVCKLKDALVGSNVNTITRYCTSLFSCKDVTTRFSTLNFHWIPFASPMIKKCNITSNRNIRQIMTTTVGLDFHDDELNVPWYYLEENVVNEVRVL